jgi:tricorn protease interacting factor F2/3
VENPFPGSLNGFAHLQKGRLNAAPVDVDEYRLTLDVDFDRHRFRGDVEFDVRSPPVDVVLDSVDLDITHLWVDGAPAPFSLDGHTHQLTVPVSSRPQVRIRIAYTGTARSDLLTGLYVSRFGPSSLLTTEMEPVGCRRLLPCFDVPDQKAVFRLRVVVDDGLSVISNGAVESTQSSQGRTTWTFEPTPKMSSYLLYLGIAPFEFLERTDGDVRLIAATSPGKSAQASYILGLAGPILRGYEAYYGLRYPLSKLHLVAVPDFPTGAMENWGAIAFSEIGLLVDDATSPGIRRWAVETVVHEIAHQWFGNLVTMRTFRDLWLNESFATFVAAKLTERLHLRPDVWGEFFIRTQAGWLGDSLTASHPIELPVDDPARAGEGFDEITYFKGANVVRMIEAFVGEEPFRRGVTSYLTKFQYGNATGADLWDALEAASGQPVRRVMETWVRRAGLPVVRVTPSPAGLHLTQERFLLRGSTSDEPPWPIPLVVRVGEERRTVLFDGRALDLPVPAGAPVQINPGRASFLRVWYAPPLFHALRERLASLAATDRWALLNDAAAFALAGELSLSEYLALAERAVAVEDHASIMEVASALGLQWTMLAGVPAFDRVYHHFHRAQMDRLGLVARPGEAEDNAVAREAIAGGLLLSDEAFARSLAARYDGIDEVDPAIASAVSYAYAMYGGPAALDRLFAQLTSDGSEDRAAMAAGALGGLPTAELLTAALGKALAPGVRSSHAVILVRSIGEHPRGRAAVWEWMRANLREFERRSAGTDLLSRLLHTTLPLVGLDRVEEVRRHFAEHSYPEAELGIRKGLEMLDVLTRFRATARESLPALPPAA